MKTIFNMQWPVYLVSLLFLSASSSFYEPTPSVNNEPAYVETSLWDNESDSIAIIATAQDSQTAAHIVAKLGGEVTSDLHIINAVAAEIPSFRLGELAAYPGIVSIVENKRIKSANSNGDDSKKIWVRAHGVKSTDRAWPVGMDVGADELHENHIRGQGVTVAVLDSGVFFYPIDIVGHTEESSDITTLIRVNMNTAIHFAGQADFVGEGACYGDGYFEDVNLDGVDDDDLNGMLQYDGYCLSDAQNSRDYYGHGSHVAGIIGSRFIDMESNTYLGIAPKAKILSVRVLDDEGMGTYEDVIEGIQFVVDNKDFYKIRVLNIEAVPKG